MQASIDKGLPKTKTFKVPFRMEMSGFARLESSIPIVGDLGVVWPVLAWRAAGELGVPLRVHHLPPGVRPGPADAGLDRGPRGRAGPAAACSRA